MTTEGASKSKDKAKGSVDIKGSAVLDEHSERGQSVSGRSDAVRKLYRQLENFKEWYYQNVSYKQETLLMLIFLFPFVALAVALQLLDDFVFQSTTYGLMLKVTTIVVSFLALYGAETINCRHALLVNISVIVSGEATLKTVCDAAKRKGQSKILAVLAYLFFAALTAAELSIAMTPQPSFYGYGSAIRYDFNRFTPNNNLNIFDESIGAQWACLGADAEETRFEGIMTAVQDVLEMEVNCFQSRPIHNRTVDRKLYLHILDSSYGQRSAFMDFEISAFDNFGQLRSKRCNLSTRDWSGKADITYYITPTGSVARRGVEEISAHNHRNCTMTGELCLNAPLTNQLGEILIKATFTRSVYTVERVYAQKLNLFPDPTKDMPDSDYSESFASSIGMMMLMAMPQFAKSTEQITLNVDTVKVKLNVNPVISTVGMVVSIATAVLAAGLIIIDLVRIRKEPDELIRYIANAIVPGRVFVESNAILIKEMIQQKIPIEEWNSIPVRFGEDRTTISDPLGKLRFGKKKDIIKYKDGRTYY